MMNERARVVLALDEALRLIDDDWTPNDAGFAEILIARQALDRFEVGLYDYLRSLGWTWRDFGQSFGISKQSAFRRYHRLIA